MEQTFLCGEKDSLNIASNTIERQWFSTRRRVQGVMRESDAG
jgi:hypothetical protein